jgi:hypothetical protein
MEDNTSRPDGSASEGVGAISPASRRDIEALVSAEVQKQLDRERTIIKGAGSLAARGESAGKVFFSEKSNANPLALN